MTATELVFFEGEEADEKVLILLRPHPITNLGWISASLLFLSIPFATWAFLLLYPSLKLPLSIQTTTLMAATWCLIILGIAFQQFLYWNFNIYILTNKRIVDIDFFGLFHRTVSQTPLTNIQDVTYTKAGILQNFFDFGDLDIQTAGTAANFEFHSIPDPEGGQKQILELIAGAKKGTGQEYVPLKREVI